MGMVNGMGMAGGMIDARPLTFVSGESWFLLSVSEGALSDTAES